MELTHTQIMWMIWMTIAAVAATLVLIWIDARTGGQVAAAQHATVSAAAPLVHYHN